MTSNLDMQNNRIYSLPTPSGNNQPATKIFCESNYLKKDGSVAMTGNLNMNNKTVKNLTEPTASDQAVNLEFLGRSVLFLDGRSAMHSDVKMGGKRVTDLNANPINSQEATSKHYVDTTFYKRDGTVALTINW